MQIQQRKRPKNFNPRPPCGGRLSCSRLPLPEGLISIHVLRVEDDHPAPRVQIQQRNFNPRPPCGGRPHGPRHTATGHHFNPRPPCGGRRDVLDAILSKPVFQSTSSVWRTTKSRLDWTHPAPISIHVLRVEDDPPRRHIIRRYTIFQSTSSVWRTTPLMVLSDSISLFQSTSSVWRTTSREVKHYATDFISIHVLRVEDDATTPRQSRP